MFLNAVCLSRDNCRCSSCVNQDTMQRTLNTFEVCVGVDADPESTLVSYAWQIRPDITATSTTADSSGVNVECSFPQ